jgi:hypothetical protein
MSLRGFFGVPARVPARSGVLLAGGRARVDQGWFARLVVLAVCALGVVGCSHGRPVLNPDPIAAARSPEGTEMAILDALPKRRWMAEEVQPGRIVASLPIKSFLVRVEIVYDERQVRIQYLSSDNLGEQRGNDGRVYAHGSVNKWMHTLALDIAQSLAAQSVAPGPVPVSAGGQLPPPPAPPN